MCVHRSTLTKLCVCVCLLQEVDVEEFAPVVGEVSSSWEVNAERLANTVSKLCKMESQNHMSPR